MPRLALAALVGLLAINVSGVMSLMAGEPCSIYEIAGEDEGGCPPTCVTCVCCAQGVEPVTVAACTAPPRAVPELVVTPLALVAADPRDILHVPRRSGA